METTTNAHDAAKAAHNKVAAETAREERSRRVTKVALAIAGAVGIIAAILTNFLVPDYWSSLASTVDPGTTSSNGQGMAWVIKAILLIVIAAILPGIVLGLSKVFPLGRSGQ